ncbi:MAG: branched-chain amino acid ABC transporter permease [Deltaproteobacteria bacterium]|nr:branched-chain amino acid ABC transporter permease [Deltaproteobacteria bacterium]
MTFFLEVLVGGLLSGAMYSLVALGFVLIFKASGVFNFAQGAMVLFSALTLVSLLEKGWNLWMCLGITLAGMVFLAYLIERIVLRPLVNQPPLALFLATIGLAFAIEGIAQAMWGTQVHGLNVGIPDVPLNVKGLLISEFDIFTGIIAAVLVAALALFFSKTRVGRALRAVADDHEAALTVGIPLRHIWVIVWAVAGIVALVAGIVWGSRVGVQFSLVLIAYKALPALILGGLDSVPGAIAGGLLIGASEKLAEVYVGPFVGGAIESWFPYMLALGFLLIRPEGLFGEVHIERV